MGAKQAKVTKVSQPALELDCYVCGQLRKIEVIIELPLRRKPLFLCGPCAVVAKLIKENDAES